jgi:hypothetical protein
MLAWPVIALIPPALAEITNFSRFWPTLVIAQAARIAQETSRLRRLDVRFTERPSDWIEMWPVVSRHYSAAGEVYKLFSGRVSKKCIVKSSRKYD